MVARYRPGPKQRHSGSFQKGNTDGRANNGRMKGSKNKLPATLKEAILGAMEYIGLDGKGTHGLMGYFIRICKEDAILGCRLAEKILPMQITGAGGGPVQVLSIPPAMLKNMSTPELEVLQGVLSKLGQQGNGKVIEHEVSGDADKYAIEIGATHTHH